MNTLPEVNIVILYINEVVYLFKKPTVSDYVNINKALCHVTQLHNIAHVRN